MRRLSHLLFAVAVLAAAGSSRAAEPEKIRVLIIDGQNNHAWQQTTPVLKKELEDCGRFAVDVATSPPGAKLPALPKDATPEQKAKHNEQVKAIQTEQRTKMEKFHPDLSKYQVVVSNYNGEPWGKDLNEQLDSLLKDGKIGYAVVHAANNAFPGWKEYNQMIGMGWRDAKFGKRLKVDESGKEVVVEAGQDQGSGHRYVGPFVVTIRDAEHPITRGMPREWMHVRDELYDNMRGPIERVHVLATAYSDKDKKGTGAHEPMIWTVAYGKGRVFHTPMGHDANAMRCHGFAAALQRGTEWAATGTVTIPLPKEFPTADKPSPIPGK
jgi:type 1 glutamine amidotransferase